jgi:hypothetical protein
MLGRAAYPGKSNFSIHHKTIPQGNRLIPPQQVNQQHKTTPVRAREHQIELPPFAPFTYFGVCTCVRDQHEDIREWVHYHYNMGAGKIYIMDHISDPPLFDTLFDFIKAGIVEYSYIARERHSNTQRYMYQRCLHNYGPQHRFLGFIDSDEFIVVPPSNGVNRSIP